MSDYSPLHFDASGSDLVQRALAGDPTAVGEGRRRWDLRQPDDEGRSEVERRALGKHYSWVNSTGTQGGYTRELANWRMFGKVMFAWTSVGKAIFEAQEAADAERHEHEEAALRAAEADRLMKQRRRDEEREREEAERTAEGRRKAMERKARAGVAKAEAAAAQSRREQERARWEWDRNGSMRSMRRATVAPAVPPREPPADPMPPSAPASGSARPTDRGLDQAALEEFQKTFGLRRGA